MCVSSVCVCVYIHVLCLRSQDQCLQSCLARERRLFPSPPWQQLSERAAIYIQETNFGTFNSEVG
jgi:hypothetical protein